MIPRTLTILLILTAFTNLKAQNGSLVVGLHGVSAKYWPDFGNGFNKTSIGAGGFLNYQYAFQTNSKVKIETGIGYSIYSHPIQTEFSLTYAGTRTMGRLRIPVSAKFDLTNWLNLSVGLSANSNLNISEKGTIKVEDRHINPSVQSPELIEQIRNMDGTSYEGQFDHLDKIYFATFLNFEFRPKIIQESRFLLFIHLEHFLTLKSQDFEDYGPSLIQPGIAYQLSK